MTRYRIRIYRSPGKKAIQVRAFSAASETEALEKGAKILAHLHHRMKLSEFVTSWAIDRLEISPVRWVTVATS